MWSYYRCFVTQGRRCPELLLIRDEPQVNFGITYPKVVFFLNISAYQTIMTSFTSCLRLYTFNAWLELRRQILFLDSLASWRRWYDETTNVGDIRWWPWTRRRRNRPKYVLHQTVDFIVMFLDCGRGWRGEMLRDQGTSIILLSLARSIIPLIVAFKRRFPSNQRTSISLSSFGN